MIDTDKGRAEISRFAVDLAIRIALIAGVVWVSLLLLRPIMPLMVWAVILRLRSIPCLRSCAGGCIAPWFGGNHRFARAVVAPRAGVMLAVSAVDTLEGYAGSAGVAICCRRRRNRSANGR